MRSAKWRSAIASRGLLGQVLCATLSHRIFPLRPSFIFLCFLTVHLYLSLLVSTWRTRRQKSKDVQANPDMQILVSGPYPRRFGSSTGSQALFPSASLAFCRGLAFCGSSVCCDCENPPAPPFLFLQLQYPTRSHFPLGHRPLVVRRIRMPDSGVLGQGRQGTCLTPECTHTRRNTVVWYFKW